MKQEKWLTFCAFFPEFKTQDGGDHVAGLWQLQNCFFLKAMALFMLPLYSLKLFLVSLFDSDSFLAFLSIKTMAFFVHRF